MTLDNAHYFEQEAPEYPATCTGCEAYVYENDGSPPCPNCFPGLDVDRPYAHLTDEELRRRLRYADAATGNSPPLADTRPYADRVAELRALNRELGARFNPGAREASA